MEEIPEVVKEAAMAKITGGAARPQALLRGVWRDLGLAGPCFCRMIRGAYRDLWIVHHGRRYPMGRNDDRAEARFVQLGSAALRQVGFAPERFFFQLDRADQRLNRAPRSGDAVGRLESAVMIAADELPPAEWDQVAAGPWEGVLYSGDRIEMWAKCLQRQGALHRVVDIAWSMPNHRATSYETVTYVGARRGAYLTY